MSKSIYINAYDIISPLGIGVENNWNALVNNQSGIHLQAFKNEELPLGKIQSILPSNPEFTILENLIIQSIENTIAQVDIDIQAEDFLLILSTTKGNIHLLQEEESFDRQRARLGIMATIIQQYFKCKHTPVVVSNACVSGVMALGYAKKHIEHGQYTNIIVCGVDILSAFVVEGFLSFKALSKKICMPFDKNREGINIGECVATVLLSKTNYSKNDVYIKGSATSNDANHISGPSRTGDGLAIAIKESMREAHLSVSDIDFISAHGTATIYNDEMESKAIESLQLNNVPINSFKGYIGHTLGAAGIAEIIFSVLSMQNQLLIQSLGCIETDYPINIIKHNQASTIRHTLKLSSGFGGCNAVMLLAI
ncbi:MAG: beta-ketoacyl synthase N-terminal-like domain-containing protein [Bacteroidota bacterium]